MSKILIRVPYLEGDDINSDGSLKNYVCKGKPTVLMVQANFCGYCTQAKPDFQQLADKYSEHITVVTIQTDGGEKDQMASQKISKVNSQRGVPAYLGFDKNGKFVSMHTGNRDLSSLVAFAKTL